MPIKSKISQSRRGQMTHKISNTFDAWFCYFANIRTLHIEQFGMSTFPMDVLTWHVTSTRANETFGGIYIWKTYKIIINVVRMYRVYASRIWYTARKTEKKTFVDPTNVTRFGSTNLEAQSSNTCGFDSPKLCRPFWTLSKLSVWLVINVWTFDDSNAR